MSVERLLSDSVGGLNRRDAVARSENASSLLKPRIMADYATISLDMRRLAVAIALLWATSAWAQFEQQAGQQSDLRVSELYVPNGAPVNSGQPRPGDVAAQSRKDQGPLRGIALRLSTGVGYDDNVFRTSSRTRSDFFWLIRPAAVLNLAAGKHGFRLGYEGEYARYFDFSTEDYSDHRLFASAGLDLTRKIDVDIGAELIYGHDPRGSLGNRLFVPGELDRWREYRFNGELVVGREITRAQIIPRIEFSGRRYLNNNQSIRDFDRRDFRLRGRWRFNPRLYGLAEVGFATIDHLDSRNTLDRTETDLLIGFGWQATAKTSGEALFGILNRDFTDPAQTSNSNPSWDVRVHWQPRTYSRVTAYTRRSSQENAGSIGNFLVDSYGARWRHAFDSRLVSNTSIDYTVADFNSGREDKYLTFSLGLEYELLSWLDVSGTYEYLNRRSNLSGLNYDDQMFVLELRAGIDRGLGF